MALNLKGLITGGTSGLIDSVKGLVGQFIPDPVEKANFIQAIENEKNRHEEGMLAVAKDIELAYLKDMDSARNMQVEALKQSDNFSKRFIYYLAMGVITGVFAFDTLMFFVHYPAENRDMINQVSGVLNTSALVMILAFFYGSSKGSKDAGERMDKMVDKMAG